MHAAAVACVACAVLLLRARVLQINVAKVDESGTVTGTPDVYALAGFLRRLGQADEALTDLVQKKDSQVQVPV